jgi:hypothetical protein
MPAYQCPVCGRRGSYATTPPDLFPFCSERCKRVDLGRWFAEQHTIDRDLTPEDLGDLPGEPAG